MGDVEMFIGHAIVAAGSVGAATALTQPLDTLKTLLQVGASSSKQLSLSEVVGRLSAVSGVQGLYSGLGWSVLGKIAGMGTRFGVYEILTAFCKDGREDNYVYVPEALLAGIATGAMEAVACTPFELLKIRQQVSSTSRIGSMSSAGTIHESSSLITKLLPGYAPNVKAWKQTLELLSTLPNNNNVDMGNALKRYPWMLTGSGRPPLASEIKGISSIMRLEGLRALWRGLRPGIARDCAFNGVFFSTWQFIHIAMLNWKATDINPPPRSIDEVGAVSPLAASVAAGFSGMVAAAASHSFDTAKCRSQCIVMPKYIAMERKYLRWKAPGIWIERVTGTSPADRKLLFRGLWLRMARSGIGSFAVVGGYLLAVHHIF